MTVAGPAGSRIRRWSSRPALQEGLLLDQLLEQFANVRRTAVRVEVDLLASLFDESFRRIRVDNPEREALTHDLELEVQVLQIGRLRRHLISKAVSFLL